MRNLISLQFGLFLFLALPTSPAFGGAIRFKVTADLGVDVPASSLNSRDEVLATYRGAPAVWSPLRGFTLLALPDNVPGSVGNPSDVKATALNDKGQIAGVIRLSDPIGNVVSVSLLWNMPQAKPLHIAGDDRLPPYASTVGINNAGEVIGNALPGSHGSIAWTWQNGVYRDLFWICATPCGPYFGSSASGINDAGVVVGSAIDDAVHPHAVLWTNNAVEDLGMFPGDRSSIAEVISNSGAVAGVSSDPSDPLGGGHAFIWKRGIGMAGLGVPVGMFSDVIAISDENWILGTWGQGRTRKPFLWTPAEGPFDLASLIDLTGTEYKSLIGVVDMNAQGDILGNLLDAGGRSHTVVFSLVPEIDTWLFAVVGLLLFLLRCAARWPVILACERRVQCLHASRFVVAVAMMVAAPLLRAEPLRYEVKIDLGVGFSAARLNDSDQILGNQQGTPGVWSPSTGFVALPAQAGVAAGFAAVNLNDKAQVIGVAFDQAGNSSQGLFWPSLRAAPITITQGIPIAINSRSHILLDRSSIWSNGSTVALPTYKSASLTPADINDADTVAALVLEDFEMAVVVNQNSAIEIPGLPMFGGVYLNNHGAIAGNSLRLFNSRMISRAFFWTRQSGTIDLGTPGTQSSFVIGIDDHSRILGYFDRDGGVPFVWQPGVGTTELTSLIDLSDRYERMLSVADINAQGDILGTLLDQDGRPHVVVLAPVPEPAVWLIGILSMLGLFLTPTRARCKAIVEIAMRCGTRQTETQTHGVTARTLAVSLIFAVALASGLATSDAPAAVVQWNLGDVRFDDGGTATGFVVLQVNDDGNGTVPGTNPELVDWDIKVSGGKSRDFPPFEYTPASTFEADSQLFTGSVLATHLMFNTTLRLPGMSFPQHRFLLLVTDPQLTANGGTVRLAQLPTFSEVSRESWNFLPNRYASGLLTTVPEPSIVTVALGVVMLIGLSLARARRWVQPARRDTRSVGPRQHI